MITLITPTSRPVSSTHMMRGLLVVGQELLGLSEVVELAGHDLIDHDVCHGASRLAGCWTSSATIVGHSPSAARRTPANGFLPQLSMSI